MFEKRKKIPIKKRIEVFLIWLMVVLVTMPFVTDITAVPAYADGDGLATTGTSSWISVFDSIYNDDSLKEMEADDITIEEDDKSVGDKIVETIKRALLDILIEPFTFIKLVADAIQLNFTHLMFGRVYGGGVSNLPFANGARVALFTFELKDGNPYGSVASLLYAVFRNMFSIFAVGYICLMCAKASWSTTGKTLEVFKASLSTFAVSLLMMYLMPFILDIAMYVRDILLYSVGQIMISIGGSPNVTTMFYKLYDKQQTVMTALMYCGSIALLFYLAFQYVALALTMVVDFVMFPLVAVMALKDRNIVSSWVNNVLYCLLAPVLDATLLCLPAVFALDSSLWLLQFMCCCMVVPARSAICQLLRLSNGGAGMGALAGAIAVGHAAGSLARTGSKIAGTVSEAHEDAKHQKVEEELDKMEQEKARADYSGESLDNEADELDRQAVDAHTQASTYDVKAQNATSDEERAGYQAQANNLRERSEAFKQAAEQKRDPNSDERFARKVQGAQILAQREGKSLEEKFPRLANEVKGRQIMANQKAKTPMSKEEQKEHTKEVAFANSVANSDAVMTDNGSIVSNMPSNLGDESTGYGANGLGGSGGFGGGFGGSGGGRGGQLSDLEKKQMEVEKKLVNYKNFDKANGTNVQLTHAEKAQMYKKRKVMGIGKVAGQVVGGAYGGMAGLGATMFMSGNAKMMGTAFGISGGSALGGAVGSIAGAAVRQKMNVESVQELDVTQTVTQKVNVNTVTKSSPNSSSGVNTYRPTKPPIINESKMPPVKDNFVYSRRAKNPNRATADYANNQNMQKNKAARSNNNDKKNDV